MNGAVGEGLLYSDGEEVLHGDCLLDWSAIPGLEDLWAAYTRRGPTMSFESARLLLSALGLGIEQTVRYLGTIRPDREAFAAWILAVAGFPDADRLERYRAAVSGVPPSLATTGWLAAITDAPAALDDDEMARWHRDGVVVLRGAISRSEAETAAAVIWNVVGGRADDRESWYRHAYGGGIWVPVYQHPALEVARRSPRVHKAFAQLWGTADLWMIHDKMSFNPPERAGYQFQGSPLHWDVSLARPIPFATQAILYLSDTAADGGALRVVPGFHHRIDAWLDALDGADPRAVDLTSEAVPIPAAAGDLVIWRQDLPHGASPNRGSWPRLAQYLNMFPAGLRDHPVWR